MSANEITWTCSVCENIHRGLPAIAFKAPAHYYGIPEEERAQRTKLNEDFCVIDREAFYVRCVLSVPISGVDDLLEWGIWSSLSEANFRKYNETFHDLDQGKLGPMFSWFASSLPKYPRTLSLRCNVVPVDIRKRPHIHFDPSQDHPLIGDIRNGISLEQAIAFVEPTVHRH
ncbi:MAG: DUF2199 domain-containing protein [Rhodomicrobium sp.]